MNIIKASPADLIEVLYLLKVCIQEMNSKGWFHWNLQNQIVKEDIEKGNVFLFKENENTLAAITLYLDKTNNIQTVSATETLIKSLVVHVLIVHPKWRKQGIGKELLAFSEKYAKENGYSSVKFDVFSENTEAVSLCNQLNYKQMGEIFYQYQKSPYYCFEKMI